MKPSEKTVDAYMSAQSKEVRAILEKLRKTIKAAAPNAEEVISYGMPAYKENGVLVYFAANKQHTGLYPTGSGIAAFKDELSPYKFSKGAIQFPYDRALPLNLISRIVKYKLKENLSKMQAKKKVPGHADGSKEQSDTKGVQRHIERLEPELAKIVLSIRKIILACDPSIGERIKWNNPSFFYTGSMKPFDPKEYKREIAVFNLHKGRIMLVFPSGAKVGDKSGLLAGDYKDGRRIAVFEDIADVKRHEKNLSSIIKKWLKLVNTN